MSQQNKVWKNRVWYVVCAIVTAGWNSNNYSSCWAPSPACMALKTLLPPSSELLITWLNYLHVTWLLSSNLVSNPQFPFSCGCRGETRAFLIIYISQILQMTKHEDSAFSDYSFTLELGRYYCDYKFKYDYNFRSDIGKVSFWTIILRTPKFIWPLCILTRGF